MKLKTASWAVFALLLACQQAFAAATLLPNGEQCFQATTGINGMVGTLGTITAGSGGTTGTYGGVSLTGGSGSGATANISVAGGVVTAVTVLNPGTQYVVGDVLSAAAATVGNVTGFSVPVNSVSINSSLAGGSVTFYIPNTTTFKSTWFNTDQAAIHQNTNPVTLDANGCAIIYGTGSYRQLLKDSLGNTIWDQITTDTSANNNTFWAGVSGGTPNAITVVDPGFNGTDGSVIQFIPVSSNTGPATLNPSGFGAISIVKDTTTGAVALSGGEIVANSPSNVVNVVYSASQANFHILNLVNLSAAQTPQTLCGAIGLKIANDPSTPNSKLDVTADQITMINASGQTISRTSVSLVLNFTVNGANGLDTGVFAPSTWYYAWLIDNGSGIASLGSASPSAPTMPSGYSYKCRLGAAETDSGTLLYRTIQLGNKTTYNPTAATNTGTFFPILNGTAGSGCGGASPVYLSTSIAAAVPPTANEALAVAMNGYNGNAATSVSLAPSPAFTAFGGTAPPLYSLDTVAKLASSVAVPILTSQTVWFCSLGAGGALFISGWKDKVNAN